MLAAVLVRGYGHLRNAASWLIRGAISEACFRHRHVAPECRRAIPSRPARVNAFDAANRAPSLSPPATNVSSKKFFEACVLTGPLRAPAR